jgi:hypothetical protein
MSFICKLYIQSNLYLIVQKPDTYLLCSQSLIRFKIEDHVHVQRKKPNFDYIKKETNLQSEVKEEKDNNDSSSK